MPHHHPLGHLHQIGEVGGDVEDVGLHPVLHLIPEQLHAGHLDDPGGGDFQVVQKDLAGDIGTVQGILQGGHVPPRPAEDAALQKHGGELAGGNGLHQVGDAGHLGVAAGDVAHGLPEELEGGGDHPRVPGGGEVGGEIHHFLPCLLPVVLGGQVAGGVQQSEGGIVVCVLWVVEIAQKGVQEAGDVPRPGVIQHGLHHQLQGVADVGALLGGGLVVGEDNHVQVLAPQGEGDLLRRVVLGVGGHFLAVDQVEPGHDLTDEGAGLTADIALTVHQQLVEEGQRLGFLPHRQVGEVLLEHVEVGPELLPALGGAGGLDDIAELLLVGQHVHQLQIVLHREED